VQIGNGRHKNAHTLDSIEESICSQHIGTSVLAQKQMNIWCEH